MYMRFLYLVLATAAVLDQTSAKARRTWWSPVEPRPNIPGHSITEGDILKLDDYGRTAIKPKQYHWANGKIPYVLASGFSESDKNLIKEAMKELESNTCIKFVEKKDEKSYVDIQNKKEGCYSAVGKSSKPGPRPFNLQSPHCMTRGLVQHELLHAAGLFHEQSRPDRDKYVTVHWENIDTKYKDDFFKGSDQLITAFNIPYDYDSIMHYGNKDFSKNGKPTITAKSDADKKMGQRDKPTEHDYQKIRKIYNC